MAITLDATLPALEPMAEVIALTATSLTLADEVMRAVQDASYTYEDVLELFNECQLELAGEFLFPDLETWEDVATQPNRSTIRLPADYHRHLRYAHSTTSNRKVKIYGSRAQLYRWFSVLDQVGQVLGIAVQGRNLFYQRIPSNAETIRINYYRLPPPLQARSDKPEWLPWHLAKKLLKFYALKELYDLIEDGQDGNKTNTNHYEKKYQKAKDDLELFIGPPEVPIVEVEEEIAWEALA